jgi:hypothetical protein
MTLSFGRFLTIGAARSKQRLDETGATVKDNLIGD